ncbi:uncharacterized protein PADG_02707 [Paracoccidioides brasiliensis Pb18]|uniref:Mg2+ transporter protein, CorA-like/Zinc transport protein ZntB n=1 Tax=Paracoccidioides brasiliensis (strain Pb18) TaxID=502780 RepID=C1G6A2_PARBD|nr:uncharacterized protein PADG_02707 [Paracoccidioides brasiliensis Pb18]EEH46609.2 hypothetical protein PADG_02707 [Paracoccidioides brasiliensis Pb18]
MDVNRDVIVGIGPPSRRRSTLEEELKQQPHNSVRIVFGGRRENWEKWIQANPNWVTTLTIPQEFWKTATDDLNGCSNAKYTLDSNGSITSLDTWSCFKMKEANAEDEYKWHQMTMFIRWNSAEQNTFIYCLDFSKNVLDGLSSRVSSVDPNDPYAWHAIFINELRVVYDKCVWKIRNLVRDAEKTRNETHSSRPDFPQLHEIARHAIHSNETLDVAVDTMDSIIHEHGLFILHQRSTGHMSQESTPGSQPIPKVVADIIERQLYYHLKELRAIKARSESLKDRLQNEINLGFNIVSQTDTATMKIISAVGLVFLPGTFISTLFGMNFFDFAIDQKTGKQTFTVSNNFWLYWAIATPVTVAVILVWLLWHYWYLITRNAKPLWKS